MTMHECGIVDCATIIGPGKEFCGRHWETLPPALRKHIVKCRDAYRQRKTDSWTEYQKALDIARKLVARVGASEGVPA